MTENIEPTRENMVATDVDAADGEAIDALPLYRKKRILIPTAILLLVAAAAYWYYVTNIRGFNATDDAYVDGNRVSISAKILGRITDLRAGEGDTVKHGIVIVSLDDADLRAQEEQSEAALADARQGIELARVNMDRALDDFQRAESQYKTKVIPLEQYEHAKSALAATRTQQKMADTRVATAAAQLHVVRTNLLNTKILAPMDGIVAKRYALPGDVVQAGQPILSVYDLSSVWVTANFEETKIGSIRIGDPVEISVDAYPDRKIAGKVRQFGASTASQFSLIPPNNASGNFTKVTQRVPVKISIDPTSIPGTGQPLLPGMSVVVRVKVG